MSTVIVPNYVSDAIYSKIDAQLKLVPELEKNRENIFQELLIYFNEHGVIPDFKLERVGDK